MTPKINSAIAMINNAISASLIVAKWVSETRQMKLTLLHLNPMPFGAAANCLSEIGYKVLGLQD